MKKAKVRLQRQVDLVPVTAPNRTIREVFSRATLAAEGVTVRIVDLEPAGSQRPRHPHWHEDFEEVIHILQGEGRLWADAEWLDLVAGDTVLIPAGVVHATFNTAATPLRLLCFFPVPEGVDARQRADFTISLANE